MPLNPTSQDLTKLNYDGELTVEALATIDTYIKTCCNTAATSRKLRKHYIQVRKYLKQPYVRELFQLKLMERGVTPDRIAETIANGIKAENGVYHEGNKVASEPNWAARQKFVQLAAEIYEVLKYVNKVDGNVSVSNQIILVAPEKKESIVAVQSKRISI